MSRSAGTLITTHNATYIPPSLMPGYKGHCPTTKFDYGETYGHATAKYFQDYRSQALNSSKSPYERGGQFPTYYTHDPTLVISNRTRTRDRFLHAPSYELSNIHHDRNDEIKRFDKQAQSHRENYRDKSGFIPRVNHFVLPVPAEETFKKQALMLLSSNYIEDVHLPKIETAIRRLPINKQFSSYSSVRDRAMRDVYFEQR
ncbi:ciliary microtubule inner protein 2C-like [Tubulanus polymorphus]|uniref:ciliary microtubule inner protein 2C-like n=1 Tax=Tubulanus polymorphus TaxID=672921 RepID=UPI003DA1F3BF